MRTIFLAVAASLLSLPALAQQFPSSFPDDSQNQQQQQVNCSDPAEATSPQCMRNQTGANPSLPGNGSAASENLSSQPGRVTTYTDESSRPVGNTNMQRPTTPLPPEPLTEFQKFIASSTGQVLPIYGVKLFQNVPTTFAPLQSIPVPPDYIVGPDDEIRVRIWGQVNFNANVHVDRAGDIYLPQIGAVHVAGLRFDELQTHVHDAIARVYRNFQMIAELGQIRSIQVYLTGEARRPGVYTVSSLATLLDALFAGGGPSVQGSLRHIELRRAGHTITSLDLYRLLVDGDKSQDTKLLSGDVIYIAPVGTEVALFGSVRRPAIYELLPGEDISAVLRDAGGVTALATDTRASLERTAEHNSRQAMEVRLDAAGLATPLKDGDSLQIIPIVAHFEKTVTLRGNTANTGRFGWHEGMHLSDLLPDRNALLSRDYWWKRAQLGISALEFQPVPELSDLRQPAAPRDLRLDQIRRTQQSLGLIPQQPTDRQQGQYPSSEDPYQLETTTPLAPVPPNSAGTSSAPYNANARGSQSAIAEPSDEVDSTGALVVTPPPDRTLTFKNVVRLESPEIDWSYAVIERIDPTSLKTQLLSFDLDKLINNHDASQDLPLQPGDIITIFSQNDIHVPIAEQTMLVRLEGEFVHSGTYSVLPGESLRSLVERAGGLSSDAYLYGSVFTRESTRVLQQRRIDEAAHQMALEMQRGTLAIAANPVSGANSGTGLAAAQASERELLAELQQVRANGRIVFPFHPDSAGPGIIPDIKLENGDTFLVPAIPSTVNVLGAVYNQNSFIYHPGSQVQALLDLAGGPNTSADKHSEFIVRANGAVVSRTVVKGVWGNEFFHLRLYPGDTIIVPEKTIKPSVLRGVLDWTQIFSQLAFGAAAINVLR